MTEKKYLDPFAIWKNMYDKTESKWNEVLHETMQKEAFSEWLGQVQNAYLQYQQIVQKTTDGYLKQVNLPTRDEISNVASLIINLEEKVDSLDQKIEDELLANSASAEINNLKASIGNLDKKLESIGNLDKKLDSILKAVQLPFETVPPSPAEESKKSPNNKK